jgi:hypothetical protein
MSNTTATLHFAYMTHAFAYSDRPLVQYLIGGTTDQFSGETLERNYAFANLAASGTAFNTITLCGHSAT